MTISTELGPVRAAIRAALGGLVPSELRVAEVLLDTSNDVMTHSVTEVALAAGVSASTVVRACQRLGYKGFQDVKLALARDFTPAPRRLPAGVVEDDPPATVLAKVLAGSEEALAGAMATLDPEAFTTATQRLVRARRVLFAAVGTSAPLAQDAAYRFVTIGIDATAPPDVHHQHVTARLLGPDDVCIAITHTGATRETLTVAEGAAAAGAYTIAITSFVRSPMTDLVDLTLVAASRELAYHIEAMASRIAHLCVLDALLVAVSMGEAPRTSHARSVTADALAEHRY